MLGLHGSRHEPTASLRSRLTVSLLSVCLLCASALSGAEILIPAGSVWKYLDDGSDQGSAWTGLGFDDAGWASGPAELGYGDGDEETVVSYGPDPDQKYITTYFRHHFDVPDPAAYSGLFMNLRRDDGAVVYLNGVEIRRSNMPAGPIDSSTLSFASVNGDEETSWNPTGVDPALLVVGDNVLAVEIHQISRSSSDISLELELIGKTPADPILVLRGPYLQQVTSTQATIRWRTDIPTDSRVSYGLAPDNLDMTVTNPSLAWEHEVELTGLAPGTTYYYGVGSSSQIIAGEDADHFVKTAPPLGSTDPIRIWVIGDSGTADASAAAVRDAYLGFEGGAGTDLWLMLGDNAYPDGGDMQYQNAVFSMYPMFLRRLGVWATFGNHDAHSARSSSQAGPYYDIFTLPTNGEAGGWPSGTEAYYSFDHANIHFVCLDSEGSDREPGSAMLTWLENDLASTDQDWIIAFWHHPPYSRGSHNSDTGSHLIDMRENALPILEAGGVDLVLCGHSHDYERSFLLDGHYDFSWTLEDEMILDEGDGRTDGDGAYTKPSPGPAPHEGAVYVVAGCSGSAAPAPLDHPVMYTSLQQLGSVVIDVEGNRLDATFLQHLGEIDDYFTIIKDPPGPVFIRGDANADGVLDIADPVLTLNHLFAMVNVPCELALDANDSETVNIADAVWSLNRLFSGGPPPPPPYPGCDVDPTPGVLSCNGFTPCP